MSRVWTLLGTAWAVTVLLIAVGAGLLSGSLGLVFLVLGLGVGLATVTAFMITIDDR